MARDDAPSTREIDSMLQRLEKRIDTLKKRYQRYFLGIDLRPPVQMRKKVVREIFELEQMFINNTAQKFKLRSLVQSFNTHKTRWNRIMRQIEEGTYKRDRHKAKRRQREREQREKQSEQPAYELNPDEDFIDNLEEIDLDSVFEQPGGGEPIMPEQKPATPQRASKPAASSGQGQSTAEKERIKQQRLAEIQKKLGMGGGGSTPPPSQNQSAPTQSAPKSNPSPASSTTGDDDARKRKLQAMRRKLDRKKSGDASSSGPNRAATGSHRSVQRTGQQKAVSPSKKKQKLEKIRRKLEREDSGSKRSINRSSSSTSGSHRRVVRRSTSSDDES